MGEETQDELDQAYLARLLAAVEKAEALAEHEHKTQLENLSSALLSADDLGLSGEDIDEAKQSLERLQVRRSPALLRGGGLLSRPRVAQEFSGRLEQVHHFCQHAV